MNAKLVMVITDELDQREQRGDLEIDSDEIIETVTPEFPEIGIKEMRDTVGRVMRQRHEEPGLSLEDLSAIEPATLSHKERQRFVRVWTHELVARSERMTTFEVMEEAKTMNLTPDELEHLIAEMTRQAARENAEADALENYMLSRRIVTQ